MSVTSLDDARPPGAAPRPQATSRARTPCRQWLGGTVPVLERDPELVAGLDGEDAARARAQAVAPTLMLGRGPWTPPLADRSDRLLGLLVLDGLLVRCTEVDGVRCPELLGRGDLLRPWDDPGEQADLGIAASWKVIEPATLAILDGRFVEVVRRWPWITQALLDRTIRRARAMSFQAAIPRMRRADDRIRLLFRELSSRWGRVTPEGVVVPLPLTNQLIAELVCLRRPTASSTMTRLAREGEIVRRPGTGFLIGGRPSSVSARTLVG